MDIRQASAEDAGLISRIIAASWREAYQELIDPVYLARLPEEYWLPTMRAWLSSGRMYGLIAEEHGQALGCVVFGRGRDESHADWGEIVSLYLLPGAIGRGLGGKLLAEALVALRDDGFNRVYLWAIAGNTRAERFYRKHGFMAGGDRVEYKIGSRDVTDVRYTLEA